MLHLNTADLTPFASNFAAKGINYSYFSMLYLYFYSLYNSFANFAFMNIKLDDYVSCTKLSFTYKSIADY